MQTGPQGTSSRSSHRCRIGARVSTPDRAIWRVPASRLSTDATLNPVPKRWQWPPSLSAAGGEVTRAVAGGRPGVRRGRAGDGLVAAHGDVDGGGVCVSGDVRERLAEHGEQFGGDRGVDGSVEADAGSKPSIWASSETTHRILPLSPEASARAWRPKMTARSSGMVWSHLVDNRGETGRDVGLFAAQLRTLQGESGGEESLDRAVVEITGDAVAATGDTISCSAWRRRCRASSRCARTTLTYVRGPRPAAMARS